MKSLVPFSCLLLLAGCGGGAADDAEKKPEAVALVKTAPVVLGASQTAIAVYGAAEAGPGGSRSITLPSEAIIANIAAPNGTVVKAGQAILTVTASPASRLELAKASSDVRAADAAYQRAQRLRKDGLVSDADVETARAAAQTASATRANLKIGTGGLTLRAPIAGVVENLSAKPGDQVAAGTVVAVVAVPGDVRARFGVDPALAQRTHTGMPITVTLIAGGTPIATTVAGVDPTVDATTRLAAIYARIPSSAHIGASEPLRGDLSLGSTANGITIPYGALLDDGGRSYVFVVEGDTAKKRDVSPGNSSGDTIQILKGLKPGEKVVVEGGTALEDDMKVREGDAAPAKKEGSEK